MSEQIRYTSPDGEDSGMFSHEGISGEARLLLDLVPGYIARAERARQFVREASFGADISLATYNYEHEGLPSLRFRFVHTFPVADVNHEGDTVHELFLYVPEAFMFDGTENNDSTDARRAPEAVLLKLIFVNGSEKRFIVGGDAVLQYDDFSDLKLSFRKVDDEDIVHLEGPEASVYKQMSDILTIRKALSSMRLGNQSRNDGTAA